MVRLTPIGALRRKRRAIAAAATSIKNIAGTDTEKNRFSLPDKARFLEAGGHSRPRQGAVVVLLEIETLRSVPYPHALSFASPVAQSSAIAGNLIDIRVPPGPEHVVMRPSRKRRSEVTIRDPVPSGEPEMPTPLSNTVHSQDPPLENRLTRTTPP